MLKKMIIAGRFSVLFLMLFANGCILQTAGGAQPFFRENVDFGFIKKIAVLPFSNNSKDQYVSEMVRDITITQMLSSRVFDVADKGVVDSILREENVQPGEPLDPQALRRLGQRLSVQAIFLGVVDQVGESGKGSSGASEMTLTLRLLDTQSGLVVWQATGNGSGDSLGRRLFGVGAKGTFEVILDLVDDLLDTIPRGGA
ncbi:MAG: CsgG/HfaB family protein [Desulfobulbaceae bacterium]|nr:CsgG/HfaB family protein [Desulfobulbaceae bacterium]HIJ78262.1 hypothetical protein [Deltaproteobacteria bacterium]